MTVSYKRRIFVTGILNEAMNLWMITKLMDSARLNRKWQQSFSMLIAIVRTYGVQTLLQKRIGLQFTGS